MHRMKLLFYACCLLVSGLMSQTLNAQKEATSPLSVGFDAGFVFTSKSNVNAHSFQFRSSYRFQRWLSLSAHASYANISSTGDFFEHENLSSGPGTAWVWVSKNHQIPVTIGPEISMRLGQGDLSISAQFGFVFNRAKVFLTNPESLYDIKFNTDLDSYNALAISYTYWPQKRFGVRVGIQIQDWLSGNYSPYKLTTGSQQRYPDLESDISDQVRPAGTPYELQLFQVGLTYRL